MQPPTVVSGLIGQTRLDQSKSNREYLSGAVFFRVAYFIAQPRSNCRRFAAPAAAVHAAVPVEVEVHAAAAGQRSTPPPPPATASSRCASAAAGSPACPYTPLQLSPLASMSSVTRVPWFVAFERDRSTTYRSRTCDTDSKNWFALRDTHRQKKLGVLLYLPPLGGRCAARRRARSV